MKFVADVLNNKGTDVWSIGPDSSVYQALERMAEKNCGALVVLDEEGGLVGIISERDYARSVILLGKRSRDTAVKEVMTKVIATVTRTHSVKDCMRVMTNQRIRHLPVVEDEKLVGVISIGDVVFSVMSEQEEMINQLENYIQGKV